MTQLIDTPALDGRDSSLKRLWDIKTLPCADCANSWNRILRTKATKQPLQHYALQTKELIDYAIPRAELDLSGVVMLYGEPGTGKTTLAKGFANLYATTIGKPTRLFALDTKRVFSELLGQSAKELGKAFEAVRFAAEQSPVVVLVDEIEAISYSRNKVVNTSDPTDLVRFVDQLLKDLDSLQEFNHAVVVGTSNFAEVIDEAFWSRADLALKIPLPDLPTRQAILQARVKTLAPLGLTLSGEELAALAKESDGLSGRTLGKLFPKTFIEKGVSCEEMSMEDVLATIREAHRMKETTNGSR